MIIQSANFRLKLEEILEEEPTLDRLTQTEKGVLQLVKSWHQPNPTFKHRTSGSTGIPKTISVSRNQILISVNATMDFLDPKQSFKSALLCMSPDFIGGAMVVYRSLCRKLNLYIMEPDARPLPSYTDMKFDMVSMVPMQFHNLSTIERNRFGTILIGGGPMPIVRNDSSAKVFATFGMTETLSHIALRRLEEPIFKTLSGIQVRKADDGSLEIKGKITEEEWLSTNDMVDVLSETEFKWLGRKDFVINSGGIKLHPETIESKLSSQFDEPFLMLYKPDPLLGQKLVLVAEGMKKTIDFDTLTKYERPKELIFKFQIPRTPSGKLDRKQAQQLLLK